MSDHSQRPDVPPRAAPPPARALAGDRPAAAEAGPGLSAAEVEARIAAGRTNVDRSHQRTDADVVRDNTLTFFNVVLASLILALIAVGEFRDGLFVGGVVAANVAIATLQELRATGRLRRLRALTAPHATVIRDGYERSIAAQDVVAGDLLHLRPGDQVVADGRVLARTAEFDESLLSGESEAVRRSPGEELRSGSFCVAGECYVRAEQVGAEAYIVRLTADARELVRHATPLTQRFNRLLRVLLIATSVLAVVLFIQFNVQERGLGESLKATTATVTTVVPVGLLLAMTVVSTVGALRVSRSGAIVQDIHAVEGLNYVDVIALDKTGTLTSNRLTVAAVTWSPGAERYEGWLGAFAAASAEQNKTAAALAEAVAARTNGARAIAEVPFSSARRWSAVELARGDQQVVLVLGAPETMLAAALPAESPLVPPGAPPAGASDGWDALREAYAAATARGERGVVLARAAQLPDGAAPLEAVQPLALITLSDELRHEVRGAFELMDELGIEPKVISGDHPRTVVALLAQLGITTRGGAIAGDELENLDRERFAEAVDRHSVFGRISPQQKARIITAVKERGHFVAMVGDGANDVHALREADVAVAMASGIATARGVAGIVLLEDSFSALIRGTQEATFVLGNTARLSKLFVAKSVYAYLLILSTNMLGLEFPFLPRQGSVMSLLTLGIPAIFISIGVPPRGAGADFTRSVLRFALPAGFALAAAAMLVQFAVEGVLGREVQEARTLVLLTIVVTGLAFVIEVLGLEGARWRNPTRPLGTVLLTAVLLGLLLVVMRTGWLRDFFELTEVGGDGWAIVGGAVGAALAAQYAFTRYWQQILDWLSGRPSADEQPRGRSV